MHHQKLVSLARPLSLLVAAGALVLSVSACIPIVLGGAVVGGLAATDRRTVGTQVEDKNIQLKVSSRMSGRYGDKAHIDSDVYNRKILLTGEVPSDAVKQDAEKTAQGIENVRAVVNELQVGLPTSLSTRSNDVLIAGKIKASFVDAKDLFSNSLQITVQHGVVYLMGRVTEREGARAASVAAGVSGVTKVVKVFDYITEAELQDLSKVKTDQDQSAKTSGTSQ
jgi:osmotically-inducible protein OsmY